MTYRIRPSQTGRDLRYIFSVPLAIGGAFMVLLAGVVGWNNAHASAPSERVRLGDLLLRTGERRHVLLGDFEYTGGSVTQSDQHGGTTVWLAIIPRNSQLRQGNVAVLRTHVRGQADVDRLFDVATVDAIAWRGSVPVDIQVHLRSSHSGISFTDCIIVEPASAPTSALTLFLVAVAGVLTLGAAWCLWVYNWLTRWRPPPMVLPAAARAPV